MKCHKEVKRPGRISRKPEKRAKLEATITFILSVISQQDKDISRMIS
jgi:hypothetical protein